MVWLHIVSKFNKNFVYNIIILICITIKINTKYIPTYNIYVPDLIFIYRRGVVELLIKIAQLSMITGEVYRYKQFKKKIMKGVLGF